MSNPTDHNVGDTMTEAAQQHRIRQVEAELASHEKALASYAPGTPQHNHERDWVNNLRADLARAKAGKWTGPHT
jgi:hypothetical protein